MLKALTFDFWGTLYEKASGRHQRLHLLEDVLSNHSLMRPRTALEKAYDHAWAVMDEAWRREHRSITTDHWLREVFTYLEADLPADVVAGLRRLVEGIHPGLDTPRLVPGVDGVLPRLSRRYELGLISDVGLTPGWALRGILRRDSLLHHFRALTFSDETGATKPLPEQFLRTMALLGSRPENTAHIGDLPETDLSGARGVGMKALLFVGVSHRQDGRQLADATFEDYGELEELLERLE